MPDQNDAGGFLEMPRLRGEEGPEVEGHIRPAHAAHELGAEEVRIAATEDGPDVEGHIRLAHEAGAEEVRIAATEDGPDVEGHIWPR